MNPTRTPEERRARTRLFRSLVRRRSNEPRPRNRGSFLQTDSSFAEDTPYRDHGYHPVDLYSFNYRKTGKSILARMWRRFDTPVFLMMLGLASSLIGVAVSTSVESLLRFNDQALALRHDYPGTWGQVLGWGMYSLSSLACACVAVLVVHYVGPLSTGSGIPEMKSVLSGIHLHRFLSFPTLFSKLIGLIFAQGSGLSIGLEGPMVHMSACVAEQMLRMPMFSRLGKHSGTDKRLELLGAACATGVVAAFGATFGGILFSIEVTSTYYSIQQLPRAGFAAIFTTVMFHVFKWKSHGINVGLFDTDFDESKEHALWFYAVFLGAGVVCGIVGAAFNLLVRKFCVIRDKYFVRQTSPVVVKLAVVGATVLLFVISMIAVNRRIIRESQADLIRDLFAEIDDSRKNQTESKSDHDIYVLLGWMLPWKLIFTALCVVLPIPCGVFTPVFLSGAILGRCFGHWFALAYPSILVQGYEPGEFAVIFGAALCAGMTQTVSTAIIVLELVGQMHLRAPVAVAVVVAFYTSKQLSPPVYDVFVWTKSIPFLYPLHSSKLNIPLRKVMRKYPWTPTAQGEEPSRKSIPTAWLAAGATHLDAKEVLHNSSAMVFPVVAFVKAGGVHHENWAGHMQTVAPFEAALSDPTSIPVLLGTVTRSSLQKAVEHCDVAFELYLEERKNPALLNQSGGSMWERMRSYSRTARRFRRGTEGLVTPSADVGALSLASPSSPLEAANPGGISEEADSSAASPLLGEVRQARYGSAHSAEEAAVEFPDEEPFEMRPLWMVYQTGADSYSALYGPNDHVVLVPGMDGQGSRVDGPVDAESPESLTSTASLNSSVGTQVAGHAPFEDCVLLKVDPAPFTMPPSMPLSRCTKLFQMLKLSYAFVVHNGRLYGVVHRTDLIRQQRILK